MFTFKKFALVGAAGLAALSISCSDSDDDEVAVANNVSAPVMTAAATGWSLTGGALVTSNVGIDSIKIAFVEEDGKNIPLSIGAIPVIKGEALEDATQFDIAELPSVKGLTFGEALLSSCPEGTKVEGFLSVTAWFAEGTSPLTEKSNKVTIDCKDGGGIDISGTFDEEKEVTIGSGTADGSATDLDAANPAPIMRGAITSGGAAVRNSLDIFTNGTNVYSISAALAANLNNGGTFTGYEGEDDVSTLYSITNAEFDAIQADNDPVTKAGQTLYAKYQADAPEFAAMSAGAKFVVMTTKEKIMLLEVKSKPATNSGLIAILRSTGAAE